MAEKFRNKYRNESARHPHWDYAWEGAYFITICTHNREHFFGKITNGKMHLSPLGVIANLCWFDIKIHNRKVKLGAFIIMPDHMHGIIILNGDNSDVGGVIGNVDGDVNGDVDNDVDNDVDGDVDGDVDNDVNGNVDGNVNVDVDDDVNGDVDDDVDNDVNGNVDGNVNGDVIDDVDDDVIGDVNGDVNGNVDNDVNGNVNGDVIDDVDDDVIVGTRHALSLPQSQPKPQSQPQPQPQPSSLPPIADPNKTIGQNRFRNPGKNTISSIVGGYKSAVTKHANRLGYDFAWQTRFYDHIIRNDHAYDRISYYIENNAAAWKGKGSM